MSTTMTKTATLRPPPSEEENGKSIEEVLSYPILLLERIREVVREAKSFKFACYDVEMVTENIGQMLRSATGIATATSPGSLYERPIRRIVADVSKNFEEAITLVRKCRRRTVLRRVMTIVSATDFRKLFSLLENSVSDMKWLLSIFDGGGGTTLSVSPIASNDCIFSWIWACIASLYVCQIKDKVEAANELASLAKDNDRNKKIIVEEGGVPPLLKLLKDAPSVDAQIASSTTLLYLADDEKRVSSIINELGVSIIVQVLGDSPANVQIQLANLVARMAEHSSVAQDDFGRENVIKPLVTLLSRDVFVDEPNFKIGSSFSMHNANGGSKGGHNKKEKEEDPKVKLRLKTSCAEALWMLARGSMLNSKRITETRGLLCLARLVEDGQGELSLNCLRVIEEGQGEEEVQGELSLNCLRVITEITAAAETNPDLRRAAFKTNSRAAMTVVDQLLKIITEIHNPDLQILAIKSIGSLARTFTVRETRVIAPLVEYLNHWNCDVAADAAIALEKFASPDNFLRMEHSKRFIECEGLSRVRKLLRGNEQTRLHGLILLCYLVLHARNSEALEQAWVLNALEGAYRARFPQHSELRELIPKAVAHLNVYHSGLPVQRPYYAPGN